jgi:hypothetical protein
MCLPRWIYYHTPFLGLPKLGAGPQFYRPSRPFHDAPSYLLIKSIRFACDDPPSATSASVCRWNRDTGPTVHTFIRRVSSNVTRLHLQEGFDHNTVGLDHLWLHVVRRFTYGKRRQRDRTNQELKPAYLTTAPRAVAHLDITRACGGQMRRRGWSRKPPILKSFALINFTVQHCNTYV